MFHLSTKQQIRVLLQKRMNENMTLKQQVIVKKQAYDERQKAAERNRRKAETMKKQQEEEVKKKQQQEMKKKLEMNLQQNKQREQDGIKTSFMPLLFF